MTKREIGLAILAFILILIILDLVDIITAYQEGLIRSDGAKVIEASCSNVSNVKETTVSTEK